MNIEQLKYPIGHYIQPTSFDKNHLKTQLEFLSSFPKEITLIASSLQEEEKNWKYRPDGWSIKQVVHHCADSHLNNYLRFRLALTEKTPPLITLYDENAWANLYDALSNDLTYSLSILTGIHGRWVLLLENLKETDLSRTFIHPKASQPKVLWENVFVYAWHAKHHLAHIKQALSSKGIYNR